MVGCGSRLEVLRARLTGNCLEAISSAGRPYEYCANAVGIRKIGLYR